MELNTLCNTKLLTFLVHPVSRPLLFPLLFLANAVEVLYGVLDSLLSPY